ncbi:Sigma2 domain of RNA polymerase sigma factor [Fragilariopsis cylindrus CCMP1102]|uniref:Sigma2 domain of RNA polymerase sigma factor n=1 Tax=Fragilariopsis cylindrus CCMP1102 TaxID=635003 RepID=A0A1E7FXG3_9STRA|nr:Sigma2 domain of RNA polymerase sigma factor [Fragilariopsis cylindrus CCMP1102]|eukprot:OEU22852.1 Sigma2 domain of RNA polymerase sigma factor [Fragilariopsis cylindrus CCMP1102]
MQKISSSTTGDVRTGDTSRKRRRGQCLMGLVCVSLLAPTNGFVNLLHPSRQQHQQQLQQPSQSLSQSALSVVSSSSSSYSSSLELEGGDRTTTIRKSQFVRLTPEEETELLRRAVEYRRLNELEKDIALMQKKLIIPGSHLPLLCVRAKAAGYGENLDEYEDAQYEGQIARDRLVTHNMGLVHYCVNQIIGKDHTKNNHKGLPLNSLSREDLIQEGAIGLARAVDKWNPDIGGKFSTYAVYWVRAAILRCIAERDDLLRVPNHVTLAVQKINKAAKRLGWVLQESGGILVMDDDDNSKHTGNTESWKVANYAKRLAEEAGLSERNFEEAMTVRRRRYAGGYVAFESWMQKTSSTGGRNQQGQIQQNHHHHNSDENEDHDRQRLESSEKTEELRSVLSKHLQPKEMEALSWRYGLMQEEVELINNKKEGETISDRAHPKGRFGEAMSFTEVGNKMQVSAEHTRRLCHKALSKLQQAAEDGTLEPALLC